MMFAECCIATSNTVSALQYALRYRSTVLAVWYYRYYSALWAVIVILTAATVLTYRSSR